MRILWIPHAPLGFGGTRAEHLMEKVAKRHDVYALSCHVHRGWKSLRYLSDLLQYRLRQNAGGYYEIPLKRIPRVEWLNTLFTNRAIMREVRRRRCDVVVLSPNPYLIGYVNFARLRHDIPIVCDYLDGGSWGSWGSQDDNFERRYVESSDAVICVSRLLSQQARAVNDFCFFIPNGVDLARFRAYRRAHTAGECKRALESVRKHQAGLQSFRSMRRIEASRRNASALRLRFSQSLASLRQRLSQAKVRSTTQRRGSTTNPLVRSERLTISVSS